MKSNNRVVTWWSRGARRRLEHEAGAGAGGALVGAIFGASAGPPGAIAGAIFGCFAGALAGAVIDQDSFPREPWTPELDEDIAASRDDPAPPKLDLAPTTSGAYSEASSELFRAKGVTFSVRHLMVAKLDGRFTAWRGSLVFDEQAPENSRLEVEIDAASIDTREQRRDAHLRSADFFDVERYPKLLFKSTWVERAGENFKVTGDLTMRGITSPVTLDVEYAYRTRHLPMGERVGFVAHGSLDRRDWGLNWNQIVPAGALAVGDRIEIHLGVEATKASRTLPHRFAAG